MPQSITQHGMWSPRLRRRLWRRLLQLGPEPRFSNATATPRAAGPCPSHHTRAVRSGGKPAGRACVECAGLGLAFVCAPARGLQVARNGAGLVQSGGAAGVRRCGGAAPWAWEHLPGAADSPGCCQADLRVTCARKLTLVLRVSPSFFLRSGYEYFRVPAGTSKVK